MSSLLIVILLTKFQGDDWSKTGLWRDILNTVQGSTAFVAPHQGTPILSSLRPIIPVFRSPLEVAGNEGFNKSDEELVGVFFETLPSLPSEVELIAKLSEGLSQISMKAPSGSTIISVDCRAYRPYGQLKPEQYAPTGEGTLVINCMTPSAESEATFNKWYAEEHIPLLRLVPGWHSSRRFTLIESKFKSSNIVPAGVPKYLALHEWVDDKSFHTREYEAAVNTPWRSEVIGGVQEKERFVLQYVGRLGEEMRSL